MEKKDAGFVIDFADIDQRILSFPLPTGSYGGLQAGAAGSVFYVTRPEPGAGGPGGGRRQTLNRYDIDRRRSSVVQAGVSGYELTPDGRKLLYSSGGNWFITSAGGSGGAARRSRRRAARRAADGPGPAAAGGAGGDGKVNFDDVEVRVDPRAEWKQIFEEAWRINRDFFYDPNMHGADWPAMKKKYEVFLPHLTSSARPVPRDPVDALGTRGRPQPHDELRRAALRDARPCRAGCSARTTRSPTAATSSRRSTAG